MKYIPFIFLAVTCCILNLASSFQAPRQQPAATLAVKRSSQNSNPRLLQMSTFADFGGNSDFSLNNGRRIPDPSVPKERKTFKRFIQVESWRSPELEALYPILCSIEKSCRDISRLMRRVSTDNLEGLNTLDSMETVNIQGENQKKLDVVANRIMKSTLCCSGNLQAVASEEEDEPCICADIADNQAFAGDYVAFFDPLDGSSNIDSGLPTGTIFGVYKKPKYGPDDLMSTILQRGTEQVVAGYCLYSASTHLVITMRTGLHMFTLDDVSGEFYLTRSNIRMPRSGSIYSFNDANSESWDTAVRYYLSDLKANRLPYQQQPGNNSPKPSSRYMGALVADVHNILFHGGIFGYPACTKNKNGKLRLLYECNPMALIVEEAGGMAIDGRSRILGKPLTQVHERAPLFIGSIEEVSALQQYFLFFARL